jgi:hypothetical protein
LILNKTGFFYLSLLILLAVFSVSACTTAAASPSDSSIPQQSTPNAPAPTLDMEVPPVQDTPTATIVWFPPTKTPTPFPIREVTPTPEMLPEVGDRLFMDTFEEANLWTLTSRSDGRVSLGKDELALVLQPTGSRTQLISLRQEPALTNFYAEITATTSMCRGLDEYGLIFRAVSTQDFYRFSLSCDGQARVDRLLNGQASSPQPWIFTAGVPTGAPGITRLGVWAQGREMRFFINGEHTFSISDPSLPSGNLGVFTRSTGENAVTVRFSDLQVYSLEP